MKRFKIGASFFVLVLICILTKQFFIFINYLIALVLHELAHVLVAVSRGYKIKMVKFDMLGMSIQLDTDIYSRDSFAINIAGPACNLFICLLCTSIYWFFPSSFYILNYFCISNLVLAIFNLLPVYPLDGGKIFRGLIKKDKTYKILDCVIRSIFFITFAGLFIWSSFNSLNWFYFLMAVFFALSRPSQKPTFSIFKNLKEKNFEKVVLVKVNTNENLYSLIKHLSKIKYTIFYVNCQKPLYIDEDKILDWAVKYPLSTNLQEIINNI